MRLPVAVGLAMIVGQWLTGAPALADARDPSDWLNRMGAAVQSTSYEGTVLRIQGGKAEALKVIHTINDGVIREKLLALEGDGVEIIRNGNEVHCILPDRRSVLVEEWNDQSTLFSTLPSSDIRFGSEYDVSIVREDRVAGRKAVMLAIRPHDAFRYGHRIWLDTDTGFPLQTHLIDENGDAIQQLKFADITLDAEIRASALLSTYETEGFRWFTQPSRQISHDVETNWDSAELPRGFRPVSAHGEVLPGSEGTVTHILYSDGLANVSVFIAPEHDGNVSGPTSVGGSNSFSTVIDGYLVTAVGEVPAATVEQIATTMSIR